MPIKCSEGKVVEAGKTEGIDFGGVTSCMTITCILADGQKVAAHDGVFERVNPHIFKALKGKLNKRSVARILAAGSGSCWTPRMGSQTELSDSFAKNDPHWKDKGWETQLNMMAPFLVSKNVDNFKQILSWHFGVSKSDIEYKNFDGGQIQITSEGALKTG